MIDHLANIDRIMSEMEAHRGFVDPYIAVAAKLRRNFDIESLPQDHPRRHLLVDRKFYDKAVEGKWLKGEDGSTMLCGLKLIPLNDS